LPPLIPPFGQPFISFSSIDSTNDEGRRFIETGKATAGMALFTAHQQKGRGQRGKTWSETKGEGIALTLLLQPHFLTVSQQFLLSAAVALGVRAFLAEESNSSETFTIKWPNDIYCGNRKMAGILIENSIRSNNEWNWSIVGIGINLNQTVFLADLPNPISLYQVTGQKKDPATIAKLLCQFLSDYVESLFQGGPEKILEAYQAALYQRGQLCQFIRGGTSFQAIPIGVTPHGELQLDRIEKPIRLGEVEWKIKLP
jgi:BirA family biotin operon repressor/biotin-[acetyl-CoA-carboxylase] ligase